MSPERAVRLVDLIRIALDPHRHDGKPIELSIIDLQVLTKTLTQVLLKKNLSNESWRTECANQLVDFSRQLCSIVSKTRFRRGLIEALLIRADVTKRIEDFEAALNEAVLLLNEFPDSPLVALTWARVTSQFESTVGLDHSDDLRSAWERAVRAVVASPEFRRTDLGGRSTVFALDDANGELATTFIFKPLSTEHPGVREREQLKMVSELLSSDPRLALFGVPTSLGIYSDSDNNLIHVLERSHGKTLQTLDRSEVFLHLQELVKFLGLIHFAVSPHDRSASTWKNLKDALRPWVRGLLPGREGEFIELMKEAFPARTLAVQKRDAHLGNWLIDESSRIIAIDLGSPKLLPAGHDFAQLIEDGALLPVTHDDFLERYALFRRYLQYAKLDESAIDIEATYDWCALYRAVWIGTADTSSKAHHQHARELASWIASKWTANPLGRAANMLTAAMNSGLAPSNFLPLSHKQRRISKAMARVLRHSAPEMGLVVDDGGFVSIDDLCTAIRQPLQTVVDVANHPGEPRFQIEDGRVRALYGHSFPVLELNEVIAPSPEEIFHGTAWSALDSVLGEGLLPRGRQNVHLTTNESEALEVGRRHGPPALLAVPTARSKARLVADAIWSAPRVERELLRIVNPFAETHQRPVWLEVVFEDD